MAVTDLNPRVLYDSHMHTTLCKHAKGEPEDYAAKAYERGLGGIIFTCHNPEPFGTADNVRMSVDQLDEYVELVYRARDAWADKLDVRLGLESDYMPGFETWLEELHQKADFEYILGSVHISYPRYKQAYHQGSPRDYQLLYFDHLAQAAETGLFDCLAHPDLIKQVFPAKWNPGKLIDDILPALDRIAATGIAMEVNTSGLIKAGREIHPNIEILSATNEREIPLVLGSDAHKPERVAADFEQALDLIEQAGYQQISLFGKRERTDFPLAAARRSLFTMV
ncbi:MAG: histidinol-phosphatase [Chloroflexi bacterium]|nr:histidinol-phosphatase [Chloroflexota bacterium]